MYARFFGLHREPFSIAPDPRCLFMSESHREALAHLLYGLQSGGGFVLLTGEIGAGKTTVCRCFLDTVPAQCHVAYIFNPKLTTAELLQSVNAEFGVKALQDGLKAQVDALNEFLLRAHAAGQNCVLVIDEAQSLAGDVLEQLRLLTNLETNERKLLQIILIGQPELRSMLARPELEQLAQRVTARFHLGALAEGETARYVQHRLAVAGSSGPLPFSTRSLRRIHRLAGGVPRRINVLCDRAMLGAYACGSAAVSQAIVEKAAREVFGTEARDWVRVWVLSILGLASAVALAAIWAARSPSPSLVPALEVAAPAPKPAAAIASTPPALETSPAPPAPPAPRASIDWPARVGNEADAWRELAALWGQAPGAGEPCKITAGTAALACFRGRDITLAMIRQLDRPGIVNLHDETGHPVPALLTGLDPDRVRLRLGGVAQTVTLAVFARAWRGEYATYWRAPTAPLQPWLAASLDKVAPGARTADTPSRVRDFQRAQGLPADSLAGPMTQMQINRALGIGEPRLTQGE